MNAWKRTTTYIENSALLVLQLSRIFNATVEHFVLQDGAKYTSITSRGVAAHGRTIARSGADGNRVLVLQVEGNLPIVASPCGNQTVADRVSRRTILRRLQDNAHD